MCSGLFNTIQIDLITCISDYINCLKLRNVCFLLSKLMTLQIFSNKKTKLVERFFGFYNVGENRTTEGLFNLLITVLFEFNIINKLIGQCYDGVIATI